MTYLEGSTDIDGAIKRHRTADAHMTILGADDHPLANQEIVIAQTRHKFLFGVNGFHILRTDDDLTGEEREQVDRLLERITALFNNVTLPFYWDQFEPHQGQPTTDTLVKAATWCADHNLLVKGHPLCWHTLAPGWLLPMSNTQILEAQLGRIQREAAGFRGLVHSWDVINEAVIMPVFDKYDNGPTRICKELGRIKTIQMMFDAARAADPTATLFLNDFDVSPAYDILVEACLEVGIRIDAIGIQSHMHQGYWGVEKILKVLEQFSRFSLPIHFTETTLVSGHLMPPDIVDLNDYQVTDWPTTPEGEGRQAREVVQLYKALLAHPLVEGITWWDLIDGGWLNAPAGLIRKDTSNKPAYDELLRLVKGEWWLAPTHFRTDELGKVQFAGFLGDYELQCEGQTKSFALDKPGGQIVEIRL